METLGLNNRFNHLSSPKQLIKIMPELVIPPSKPEELHQAPHSWGFLFLGQIDAFIFY
jgi:hypothetical protein